MVDQKLSRKLVHTTTAPIFVLTWPLFSTAPYARFIAAFVPFLNLIRILAVGTGVWQDPGFVKSVSREGDRSELLRGPLYYCIVMVAATVLFWRENPAGLIAISMMCGGDGFADMVGRRLGTVKLPFNTNKSYAGSLAMFIAGGLMSLGFTALFSSMGYFECFSSAASVPPILAVCFIATVVESLPINQYLDDNLSVPAIAAALTTVLVPFTAAAASSVGVLSPGA